MEYSGHELNQQRQGYVYLVAYKAGSDHSDSSQKLRAHHSVLIDIWGESSGQETTGLEAHLGVRPDNTLVVLGNDKSITPHSSKVLTVTCVGQLCSSDHIGMRSYRWKQQRSLKI